MRQKHPGEIYLAAACDLRLERAEEFSEGTVWRDLILILRRCYRKKTWTAAFSHANAPDRRDRHQITANEKFLGVIEKPWVSP